MHVLWRLLWRSAGAAENLEVFFWRTAFDFVKHRLDPFGPCRSDTICTSMWLPQQQDVCLLPRVPKSAHKKHKKRGLPRRHGSQRFPSVLYSSGSRLAHTCMLQCDIDPTHGTCKKRVVDVAGSSSTIKAKKPSQELGSNVLFSHLLG